MDAVSRLLFDSDPGTTWSEAPTHLPRSPMRFRKAGQEHRNGVTAVDYPS